jgi:hypothetical protein
LAAKQLMPMTYEELRGLADRYVARLGQNGPGLLQPTALVHEVFLRLADHSRIAVNSRTQFFALAAATMRNVLVDGARAELAKKRGVNWLVQRFLRWREADLNAAIAASHNGLQQPLEAQCQNARTRPESRSPEAGRAG